MNELISIIIPIYNAELYLAECMEYVLNQTYHNIEIILIDDGSRDRSAELCKKYLESDNRIKYFYKENGGAASARNYGIEQAYGKYLYFMDVDDFLEKSAIELLYNAYQMYQVDFVIGNVKHICMYGKEELEWPVENRIFKNQSAIEKLVYEFADDMKSNKILYCAWGKLYRADIIKKVPVYFNEKMHTHEDNVFVLEYLSNCNSAYYIGKCLYIYRNYWQHDSEKKSYGEVGWLAGNLDFRYIVKEVRKILLGKRYNQVIGNFYSEYAIVTMFHCVRQIKIRSGYDLRRLYSIIYRIVTQKTMQKAITYYVQKHDDNAKIIPFFIKRRWIMLIIITFKLQIAKLERKNKA